MWKKNFNKYSKYVAAILIFVCAILYKNFYPTKLDKLFLQFCRIGDKEMVAKLLEMGKDPNKKIKENLTPFFAAISICSNIEVSKLLIERGANINMKMKYNMTPLLFSLYLKCSEIAELLINNGADVNIKDKISNNTPLILAVQNKDLKIAKLILSKNAKINDKDLAGKTALLYAIENCDLEITKLLLENGADVNIKSEKKGLSPLDLAKKNDCGDEINNLLHKYGAKE